MRCLGPKIVTAVCVAACVMAVTSTLAQTTEKNDVLFSTMQRELQRAQGALGKLDPAPYFTSYSVHDESLMSVVGSEGGILTSTSVRRRSADVIMRVGTAALDNTHGAGRASAISTGSWALAMPVFISTASAPSSIAMAASDAVPTPASTISGTPVIISRKIRKFASF